MTAWPPRAALQWGGAADGEAGKLDSVGAGGMNGWLRRTPDGQWEAVLEGDPDYCRALPMAPATMEPELRHGLWLVLVAAPWSIYDVRAIPQALSVVTALGGRVRLGVRPFDDCKETQKWCPQVPKFHASPLWLLFREGELIEQAGGERSRREVRDLIMRNLIG